MTSSSMDERVKFLYEIAMTIYCENLNLNAQCH